MTVRLGIFVVPDATDVASTVEQIVAADRSGLDVVGVQDHPYQARFRDTWTLLSWRRSRSCAGSGRASARSRSRASTTASAEHDRGRLRHTPATALQIDPGRVKYTALGDLATATDKARRDAPAIPVCDV